MSNTAVLERLMRLSGELHTPAGTSRRKFDLAHMRALLKALGNPETSYRSVLIAGTNGKGSTAATLASIVSASGYNVGLYTSPHLASVNERIRLLPGLCAQGGENIKDADLFRRFEEVEAASSSLIARGVLPNEPSFFETFTAIAMLTFAETFEDGRGVDLAIFEVGMGGRLDATNVVEPLLSIITDISLDHTEWLGPTIAAISREKAGILRAGGTMITLPQHPEANQALGEVAVALGVRGLNAVAYLPGRDASWSSVNHYELLIHSEDLGSHAAAQTLTVDSPLPGHHQQRNLALAITAAIELNKSHGYQISVEQIATGIRQTLWPGRLELLTSQFGYPAILLDVAHNPAGAWALRSHLSQMQASSPRLLIFGCMRDKALKEMAQILFPPFDHVYLVELASPRSAALADLEAAAEQAGVDRTPCFDIPSALKAARVACSVSEGLIVAAGSVVLVGTLRSMLL